MSSPGHSRLTRGQFLKVAGAAAAGLVPLGASATEAGADAHIGSWDPTAVAAGAGAGPLLSFHSRPDLRPPRVTVSHGQTALPSSADRYWFLGPGKGGGVQVGPLVVGEHGRVVWFRPLPPNWYVMNVRAQVYRGKPVLTWWQGTVPAGGLGQGVIVDSSYREIARVHAGNGHTVDPHELLLTPEGTALITCSNSIVAADLSSIGGAKDGTVYESVVQEIDIATGRVLLEWRSLDHVSVHESYMRPGGGAYDFMHANSIDVAPDGNLLVSGRHTWALYKLERRTGQVMWRLGGKRSDFAMGSGAQFAWQHDGQWMGDRTITVFDDGAAFFAGPQPARKTHSQSRGLVLEVDEARKTVREVRSYRHHPALLTYGYGNMQTLRDREVVVSWGDLPVFSRYAHGGALLAEAHLPPGYGSYRAYQQPWKGAPVQPPALVASRVAGHRRTRLYASWNGATGVAAWRVSLGRQAGKLRPVGRVKANSFETALELDASTGYAAVTALDHRGRALATSHAVKL